MAGTPDKASGAFRTIGEVSRDLGIEQHVLRYWEGKFPELRPLQRAGGRRYYRPDDVALVRRIDLLLNHEGYTIRGVQKLFAAEKGRAAPPPAPVASGAGPDPTAPLRAIRDRLAQALAAS